MNDKKNIKYCVKIGKSANVSPINIGLGWIHYE
jgi:hypothetical protein